MPMMNALLKTGSLLAVRKVPVPTLGSADDVRVRVVVAGLCRTDLYVADGRIPAPDPLILGHEFAGTVDEVGPAVSGLRPGDRVAVLPLIPCRTCDRCLAGDETNCLDRTMLGVERDGAFAEFVVVPARCVFLLPTAVPFLAAAYAEPVAAALGVLNAEPGRHQRGLVLGRNRFATLVGRVLQAHGFAHLTFIDPCLDDSPPADTFDFVIETDLSAATLAVMVRAVRPRGLLILKSRVPGLVGLDLPAALRKELTIRAVQYGPFRQAVGLLAEGRIDLGGLLGPTYPLEAFEQVFALGRKSESAKLFFDLTGDHVRRG